MEGGGGVQKGLYPPPAGLDSWPAGGGVQNRGFARLHAQVIYLGPTVGASTHPPWVGAWELAPSNPQAWVAGS